ncbi:hypothetical protein QAD02_021773 [Eretmocerus hayati]|uniref:Uncharacterized protein n=1 Tax=Eretmocerus hayati TaxID=131215 RepID=A0ACC2PVZ7_9HYME|nr:hypothetical protein QAD02_021773 [Eretmocerus hayati]
MAYNLCPRDIARALRDEDASEESVDEDSGDEDHVSEQTNTNSEFSSIPTKKCLDELVTHLATPHLQNRYANMMARSTIRTGIQFILRCKRQEDVLSRDFRPRFES